jgi:pyruvate dehydrogenase E1 component alpha subunit
MTQITVSSLIEFESEVEAAFSAGKIKGPIHLSGGNEQQLIDIFGNIRRSDWVFSTYRNHFHALLHGIPREKLMEEIMAGRNMNFSSKNHRFFTSAIVAGTLPIATGVAAAIKRRGEKHHVWCFVGDMAATTGAFHEATNYAKWNSLPITFIVEDNDMAANSPTVKCWGLNKGPDNIKRYWYKRTYPHAGAKTWVNF